METIFDRFPTLSDVIFEYLDEKSLANCVVVNRKWQSTIANQKVYFKMMIQNWSKHCNKLVRKEWRIASDTTPLELLRRLSEYIREHQCFGCNSKSIENKNCKCLVFSPTAVATLHGDMDLFKHIAVKINKNPKTCLQMTSLHLAAFEGHLEICKWYIENIGKVNDENDDGWIAVHFAANNGQVEIFNYLLENGADLYLKDQLGHTTLHLAAEGGSLKVCKLIVEVYKGIDINAKDIDGWTALHFASEKGELETVKFLFKSGGDLNSRANDGDTPLHSATQYGHTEVVKFILAKVIDKNPENEEGDTPLHEAANKGFLEICKLICRHLKDTDPKNNSEETPLLNAVVFGELETVKFLFEIGTDSYYRPNEDTLLHAATRYRHTEVVKFILSKVIDKNPENEDGDTPLHEAAKNGSLEICKLICLHINRGLDKVGAEVAPWKFGKFLSRPLVKAMHPENNSGETPMFNAVEKGELETVKFLFNIGGDLNSKNDEGDTPLHAATRYGHTKVVKFILANVVDKNPTSKE